jgi:hypothetical protein
MSGGRPSFGVDHVDSLEAPEEEKVRLKTVLRTLTEELSVQEACERLEIGSSRFHQLRREVLEAAIAGTRPGRPGRPRREEPEESGEIRQLRRRVAELEEELELAMLRTEIAVTMPHLLRPPRPGGAEKGGSSAKRKRRRRR